MRHNSKQRGSSALAVVLHLRQIVGCVGDMRGDWDGVGRGRGTSAVVGLRRAVLVHLTAEVLLEEVRELLGEALRWKHVMLTLLSKAPVVSGQLPGRGDGMELTEVPPAP